MLSTRDPEPMTTSDDERLADDRLRLIFTCCHPALPLEARVALTLRTLAGLTTAEIARAFLVPEATMAQAAGPGEAQDPQRRHPVPGAARRICCPSALPGVLAVLYLLFNEGYAPAPGADLMRRDLAAEAIRLARVLVELMPDEPEARGLLALMLLQDSRRSARVDAQGTW